MRDKIQDYAAVEAAAMKFVNSVAEGNSTYAKSFSQRMQYCLESSTE